MLYYKIKNKYKKMKEQGIELLPIYLVMGLKINTLDDELTIGEMYKYIKREKQLVKNYLDNNILAKKIEHWAENVRNSHFLKDLILSKFLTQELKYNSLILDEIICCFD